MVDYMTWCKWYKVQSNCGLTLHRRPPPPPLSLARVWSVSCRDLCLHPSVDVSRLASMVRSDGGGQGETAKVFRFEKRHYRVLETLALPGVEDAPVRYMRIGFTCFIYTVGASCCVDRLVLVRRSFFASSVGLCHSRWRSPF